MEKIIQILHDGKDLLCLTENGQVYKRVESSEQQETGLTYSTYKVKYTYTWEPLPDEIVKEHLKEISF